MSPQLAAGLTALVGACLVAGWITGFRNRSYVGWLGLAFLALSGAIWALGSVRAAHELGLAAPREALIAKALVAVSAVAFVLSAVTAVRETVRRLREIRAQHDAAAEALLSMIQASREESEPDSEESGDDAASKQDQE